MRSARARDWLGAGHSRPGVRGGEKSLSQPMPIATEYRKIHTAFALKELTADDEARIGALLKKAVG